VLPEDVQPDPVVPDPAVPDDVVPVVVVPVDVVAVDVVPEPPFSATATTWPHPFPLAPVSKRRARGARKRGPRA
jgi:hypothetical protein